MRSVSSRAYGQYCGFARALEIVGERWALLIVRDLLLGAKRFTDLLNGLPGIPSNVLTARLKELEQAGVVRRRLQERPARGVVYELTEYGTELETVVFHLGRWGAKAMGDPRPTETITPSSFLTALRTTFRPDAARGVRVRFEIRLGPIVASARVDDGTLAVAEGPDPDADLTIEAGPAIRALMGGEMTPAEAIENGSVRLTGDPELLQRFVDIFHVDAPPANGPPR
jgi:DNA-binding HxlR family transcriptional regulator/putative sterol carrier protein